RMAQSAIGSPFREFDFCHQGGFRPMRPLICFRPRMKRTRGGLNLTQQLIDARQLCVTESGARMTGIAQHGALIHAQQQSAKKRRRIARLCPSTDDKLLPLHDFELSPLRTSTPGTIGGFGSLGDQPFPAPLQRTWIEDASISRHEFAESK